MFRNQDPNMAGCMESRFKRNRQFKIGGVLRPRKIQLLSREIGNCLLWCCLWKGKLQSVPVLFCENPGGPEHWGCPCHRKNALWPWDQVCREAPVLCTHRTLPFRPSSLLSQLSWSVGCIDPAGVLSPAFSMFKGSHYLLPFQRSKDPVISCFFKLSKDRVQRILLSPAFLVIKRSHYLLPF